MARTMSDAPEARRATRTAVAAIVVVGALLAIAFFPSFFNLFSQLDDEGTYLTMLRSFLERGDVYDNTFTIHGPFYFLVTGPIYWLAGEQPTLDNGRLIVLVFITISAALFAGTVWRITKSLPWTLLCQVGTFLILVTGNRPEPMHPGSLVMLLLAALSLSLASYSVTHSSRIAVVTGAIVGALVMTKINIGFLALGALVLAFAIGNGALRPKQQAAIITVAVVAPFVLVVDNISQPWAASIAVLVALAIGVLATVSLSADEVSISKPALLGAAAGFAALVGVSLAFVFSTGTSLHGLFEKMVLRPTRVANAIPIKPTNESFNWAAILAMIAGALVLLTVRQRNQPRSRGVSKFSELDLALAIGGLSLFGVGVARFGSFDTWLPLVVLLPALAIAAGAGPEVRLALRLLVPLAVLQFLHIYPNAGSQVAWATVAIAVPCAIAIAAGSEKLSPWVDASRALRGACVGALCLIFMLATQMWPPRLWKDYVDNPSLDLPGARLVRIAPAEVNQLRDITTAIRTNCDALWFSPFGLGSFYVFTEMSAPTGLFYGFPPGLFDRDQEVRIVRDLSAIAERGDDLCVLVDTSSPFPEPQGPDHPLTKFTAEFTEVEAAVGPYQVRVRP